MCTSLHHTTLTSTLSSFTQQRTNMNQQVGITRSLALSDMSPPSCSSSPKNVIYGVRYRGMGMGRERRGVEGMD